MALRIIMQTLIIVLLLIIVSLLGVIIWLNIKRLKSGISAAKKDNSSPRLEKALEYIKKEGRITNDEYQKITGLGDSAARYDLDKLEALGLIGQIGKTGRGVYYELVKKPEQ